MGRIRQIVVLGGEGYVGKIVCKFLKRNSNNNVLSVDKSGTYISINGSMESEANYNYWVSKQKHDFAFICVPTPMIEKTGRCDTSIVEECVKLVNADIIVIKSTVEPGTTDRLIKETGKNIVFSPEYAGMILSKDSSSYWTPYKFHTDLAEMPHYIFGGKKDVTAKCVNLYMEIAGPTKTYCQTDALKAELAKYMENTFFMVKILFCHEFAEICRASGVDYNEVRELWLLDPRINKMHTSVFEKDGDPVGGRCLPKDMAALIYHSYSNLGYDPKFLKEVVNTNERIGRMNKKRSGNK